MAIVGGLVASLALSAPALAQFSPGSHSLGDRLLPVLGNGGYDALHYDVTLNYEPVGNTMLPGTQTDITMKATQGLSSFALDLDDDAYTVSSVTIDGVPATVSRGGDKLVITPAAGIANGATFHTVIAFVGTPLPVIDPDGSTEGWARIDSGGFVVNEPMGTMGWLPANNHPADKATYAFHITAPATHVALGNGELVGPVDAEGKPPVSADGSTRTWNWKLDYPMATYLSTASVARFDYRKWESPASVGAVGKSGRPLELYDAHQSSLSATQKANAKTNAERQDDIIKFMEDALGRPYPFESHGTVLYNAGLGYALEVQTKSHFSSTSISLSTLAHEIAHQWFGDSIGPKTWDELWFNEGWATWWAWYWGNKQNNGATTAAQFTSVYNSTNVTNWSFIPANLPHARNMFDPSFPTYNRSGAMLEGYRQIVGDAAFWDFQRALIDEFSYSTISTDAFIALAKRIAKDKVGFEATNLSKLDTYFTQWLRTAGKPTMTPSNFFLSSTVPGNTVGGTVPATLSLTLGAPATFGTFTPGLAKEYTAATKATVISTAGDATLTHSEPGHLANGAFTLAEPLRVELSKSSWTAPVSNEDVDVTFKQQIKSTDPLRTGSYSKSVTFTLSTTTP